MFDISEVKMILDLYAAQREFEKTTRQTLDLIRKSRPLSYLGNSRFSATRGDVIGSSIAAIESYKALLPWIVDQNYSFRSLLGKEAIVELSDGLFAKWVTSPSELTEGELLRVLQYQAASLARLEEMKTRHSEEKTTGYSDDYIASEQRFSSTIKSFLFFIRSFQDSIYALMLDTTRNPTPDRPNMLNAFNNNMLAKSHQVYPILSTVSGYEVWFTNLNYMRNQAKMGVECGWVGPLPDFGISLAQITKDGTHTASGYGEIRASDIIKSLRISSLCVMAISMHLNGGQK
jgi:hypothetical protein